MNIWLSIGCFKLMMFDELAIFREDVSRYTNGRYSLMFTLIRLGVCGSSHGVVEVLCLKASRECRSSET